MWLDMNGDGTPEGENGIGDIEVILFEDGVEIDRTTTSNDGSYLFENLPEGMYTVRVERPASQFLSGFDLDGGLDDNAVVPLLPGQHRRDVDFAFERNFVSFFSCAYHCHSSSKCGRSCLV